MTSPQYSTGPPSGNRQRQSSAGKARDMGVLLTLRRWTLTPSVAHTRVARRGFHAKTAESVTLLESVGRHFLTGYAAAVGTRRFAEAEQRMAALPDRFRGFAYEGAAMGYAVLDGLVPGRRRIPAFLAGPGAPHIYMAHVGIGWALARVPRWRWRAIFPADDPLLSWLVLDGYGFHQAYFHTDRYVRRHHQDRALPWPVTHPGYAPCVVDQGIGRALWFVAGTDGDRAAAHIDSFPTHRRADLWSGVGLAATYAGGADDEELARLRTRAGAYRPQMCQGCVFGTEARLRAGLMTEHTARAARVLCDATAADAAALATAARRDLPEDGPVPAYQVWRDRIADAFASHGRW